MGDHTCAPAPPLPDSRLKVLDGPFAPSKQQMPPPSSSNKTRPPRLNPTTTFDSFLHSQSVPPPLRSPITTSSSRSASPVIPANGRRSPFQMPSRSATSPLPAHKPPSPELSISQDCAFPPFPTSRSRSATPTTPSEASFSFSSRTKPPEITQYETKPLSHNQRGTGNGGMMQRMDSIAPGPFRISEKDGGQQTAHKRTPSTNSTQDSIRPSSSWGTKKHHIQLSTSSSNYTRHPSISSTTGSTRFTFERSKTEIPAVPAVPQQSEVDQNDTPDVARTGHQPSDSGFDFGSFGQDNRSQTFPNDDRRNAQNEEQSSFHRRPSEPSPRSHKPRPSVAAAVMQPLHEIGSTSSFKPSKSLRGRNQAPCADQSQSSKSKAGAAREDERLGHAPPVPLNTNVPRFESSDPYHTPHESTSSNDSYSSGAKTGSSRSSPPLNDSPQRPTADSFSQMNNLFNDFQFDVDRRPSFDDSSKSSDNPSSGYLKPRPSKPTIPTLSPYDGPPQRSEPSIKSPDDYLVSPFAPHSDNIRVSPAPLAPPPLSVNRSAQQTDDLLDAITNTALYAKLATRHSKPQTSTSCTTILTADGTTTS
ncbi:hypothetical protein ACLMJK_006396 [Lecanora helva]